MEKIIFDNGSQAIPTELEDCYIVIPRYFNDSRGYFTPDFILKHMQQIGFKHVVQHNTSESSRGVVRGMHFQLHPYAQAKIVSVITGAAVDIVTDIRVGSPTYGKSIAVLLTPYNPNDPESGKQLYVPRGFAHGFISLKDNTKFQYFIDNDYAIAYEGGISWRSEECAPIFYQAFNDYNLKENEIITSPKDEAHLILSKSPTYFNYSENIR